MLLREETGVEAGTSLGAPVHQREVTFEFGGITYQQTEDYFVARTTSSTVRTDDWTVDERRVMTAYRWWSQRELAATTETVPEDLVQLLARVPRTDGGVTRVIQSAYRARLSPVDGRRIR